jgi:hypothetical protein
LTSVSIGPCPRTVQHEVMEGDDTVPFVDGDDLSFTITR